MAKYVTEYSRGAMRIFVAADDDDRPHLQDYADARARIEELETERDLFRTALDDILSAPLPDQHVPEFEHVLSIAKAAVFAPAEPLDESGKQSTGENG